MSGQGGVPLSSSPRPSKEYSPAREGQYRAGVAQNIEKLSTAVQQLRQSSRQEYTLSNVSDDRELDADSTTLAEVADVVGTLIGDLQDAGIIG